MDRRVCWTTIHGVAKNWTQLSRHTFYHHEWPLVVAQHQRICLPMQYMWVQFLGWEDPLEKEVATHFSVLAWEIPWTEEPGGLQSMGPQRVGHILATQQILSSELCVKGIQNCWTLVLKMFFLNGFPSIKLKQVSNLSSILFKKKLNSRFPQTKKLFANIC